MDIQQPLSLLGGLSATQFMQRHWQKKPLLIRNAVAVPRLPIDRAALFALASREDVESRLVRQDASGWTLRHGPFARRALPPLRQPDWTLLVQGVDLHHDGVRALLDAFRFLPDARIDDLMVSYASDGGGVGAHFDSYDVFLLQARGRRRWSIGRQHDLALQPGTPLKILQRFEPEQHFVLEAGDMLYLPPRYAHDGVALGGDCMTYSIGLRSSAANDLAADLLARLADAGADEAIDAPGARYRDAGHSATDHPAALPAALQLFARDAVRAALRHGDAIDRALGESLTEPKAQVWFEPDGTAALMRGPLSAVTLDRRTRMLYDARHVYINGESFRASGRDATLMHRLADQRSLGHSELARASADALKLIVDWCEAGWLKAGKVYSIG